MVYTRCMTANYSTEACLHLFLPFQGLEWGDSGVQAKEKKSQVSSRATLTHSVKNQTTPLVSSLTELRTPELCWSKLLA